MSTLLILDTFNFLHRAFHAIPATLTNSDGEPINAVYGVASMLLTIIADQQPTYLVAAMESKEKEIIRASQFVGYKATRPEMDSGLRNQIPKVERLFSAIGIPQLKVEGYEADDVIGTLATQMIKVDPTLQVLVVSNDQDMMQLINPRVKVLSPTLGSAKKPELYDEATMIAKYGFKPRQMIDYKSLRGDPSDNIPGVFGIGEKTAKELIEQFGNLDAIYNNLGKVTKESVRTKLAENAEMAVQSKMLATINCDLPLSEKLADLKLPSDWKIKAIDVLKEFHFKSLVARLEGPVTASKTKVDPDSPQLGLL
ncbi:MAG: hypothetical protein NT141_01865 [candidate division WWE3 bacterium]|nr:hypothetical protein [candidate division WWE3 bacterium]